MLGVFIQVFTKPLELIQREDAPGIYWVVRLDRVDHADNGITKWLVSAILTKR
jgi:hypothetical protein